MESEKEKAHMLVLNEQVAPASDPFEDRNPGHRFACVDNRRVSTILEIATAWIVAFHADIGKRGFARDLYVDRDSQRLHFRTACLPKPAIKRAGIPALLRIGAKLEAVVQGKRDVGRQKEC